MNDGNLITST